MKTKSKLKVTIIVPVHNSEKTLDRCINSIINQKYENIECILVENGSTDNSEIICNKYKNLNNNIVVSSIDKNGVSAARNRGLELATGDIIGFCDSDDFLENNAVSIVVQQFLEDSEIVAVFGSFYKGTMIDSKINKTCKSVSEKKVPVKKALQLNIIDDSIMGSVWNKYYKADVVKKVRFSNELSYCEDMHFNAMVLNRVSEKKYVKLISKQLYCYMDNRKSVTNNQDDLFDKNGELKYIISLKAIINDCKLDKETLGLVKMKIACMCIDYLMIPYFDDTKRDKLRKELNENYVYLLKYIWKNNLKWNIKRALIACKYLI